MISAFLKLPEDHYLQKVEERERRAKRIVFLYNFLRWFGIVLIILWIPGIVFITSIFGWLSGILFAIVYAILFFWFYGFCWPKTLVKLKRKLFLTQWK